MPHLDATALETDVEGLALLRQVIGPVPDARPCPSLVPDARPRPLRSPRASRRTAAARVRQPASQTA
ncbi:MAG: hypothetical protein ACOYOJ_20780 [Alsobacter sp.]